LSVAQVARQILKTEFPQPVGEHPIPLDRPCCPTCVQRRPAQARQLWRRTSGVGGSGQHGQLARLGQLLADRKPGP
jgi:hypothetical protein